MEALRFDPIQLPGVSALPTHMLPIARAADLGADLMPEITALVHQFGFSSFTYWAAARSTSMIEGRVYELSTLPREWALRYDDMAYLEIDPRIRTVFAETLPIAWEYRTWSGRIAEVDAFLDDAANFGIGSGVCVPIHDAGFGIARFDFDSKSRQMNVARRQEIEGALGNLSLVARFLHDLFVIAVRRHELRSRFLGMPLSQRERELIVLATRGSTAEQLADVLRIDPRIVNAHFDSIRAKLGCLNRDEAVAYALKRGLAMS